MTLLKTLQVTKHTGAKHTGTVLFFHGSGSNGPDMKNWVAMLGLGFTFPHIKVLFPTAPKQPYTPSEGKTTNVWFDRKGVDKSAPEDLDSISKIEPEVKELIRIQNEDCAIPSNRIIVGGFSMGGALAIHTGYRWDRDVAGVFAFGSFINDNSIVYKELKEKPGGKLPPLLHIHGDADKVVNLEWGKATFEELKALGVQGEFHVMQGLDHSLNRKGVGLIKTWIAKVLPEV